MNYRYKLSIQKAISALPLYNRINYFFQLYASKSIPLPDELFISKLTAAKSHYHSFLKYKDKSLKIPDCNYYEFGAGWDLTFPLVMSALNFREVFCIDLCELIFPYILNNSVQRLGNLNKIGINYDKEVLPPINKRNYRSFLKENFRIKYDAPKDARNTGFESNSIDFIISHATLEHIPPDDIKSIMRECNRIIKPGGILSFEIDYADHFSYFDNSITEYNFLRFTEKDFSFYNSKVLYQNRLRHKDYLKILNDSDFEILEDNPVGGSEQDLDKLKNMKIDGSFLNNYSLAELAIKKSRIVFRKKQV